MRSGRDGRLAELSVTEPSASSEVKRASAASPAVPSPSNRTLPVATPSRTIPFASSVGAERLADQMPGALRGRCPSRPPRRWPRSPLLPAASESLRVDPAGGDRAARGAGLRALPASSDRSPRVPPAPQVARASCAANPAVPPAHPRRRSGDRRRGGHALEATVGTADDDDVVRVERHPCLRGLDRAVERQILRSRGDRSRSWRGSCFRRPGLRAATSLICVASPFKL